jgi:hypothetical protein
VLDESFVGRFEDVATGFLWLTPFPPARRCGRLPGMPLMTSRAGLLDEAAHMHYRVSR